MTIDRKEFLAIYPALHEVIAANRDLLEFLDQKWKLLGARPQESPGILYPYLKRIEAAIEDPRLSEIKVNRGGLYSGGIEDIFRIRLNDISRENHAPSVGDLSSTKWLLRRDWDAFRMNVVEMAKQALGGQDECLAFFFHASRISKFNGSLPSDGLASILAASEHDQDNIRPVGCRRLFDDLSVDCDTYSVVLANQRPLKIGRNLQFKYFVAVLYMNRGHMIDHDQAVELMGVTISQKKIAGRVKKWRQYLGNAFRGTAYQVVDKAIGKAHRAYGLIDRDY